MDYSATPHLIHLNPTVSGRRTLRIRDPRGYRVVALCGTVWVTQERRLEDTVLKAGEAFDFDANGLAVITALESSDVEIVPPAPAAPAVPARGPIDFAAYERSARRLRAEAVHALLADAWGWLRGLIAGRRATA